MAMIHARRSLLLPVALAALAACAAKAKGPSFHNPDMDFGSVRTVAVMPFGNLSRETAAADRVREVFSNMLLATGAMYVLPQGEVARGVARVGVATPSAPTAEEVVKLCALLKADAVITGVVKEYGEIRSGSTTSNAISVSTQMMEGTTGKVVWAASSTQGGIGLGDRMLGGGGRPLNDVTEAAVNELLDKLFK
jgi:hypothetical protein